MEVNIEEPKQDQKTTEIKHLEVGRTSLLQSDDLFQPNMFVKKKKLDETPEWEAYHKLLAAIYEDDPEEFLRRMYSPWLDKLPDEMSEIGFEIISNCSVRCAAVVVSGCNADYIDRDFGFDSLGWSALHEAALDFENLEMVRLFLEHDYYSADVRGDYYPRSFDEALPLNVALHTLKCGSYLGTPWNSTYRSASSVVKKLCTMDKELEVLRLLALKTTEFKHEFFNYAKEGKMVEVGFLLLAAGDKLLPLSIPEGEDDFNSFEEISHFLQEKNNNIDEFPELKETVKFLDIYHKIGNQLSAYVALKKDRRTGAEFAALLKDAGFDKNTADNNFQDYANRSNNDASFELKFPQIYSSREPHESIPKEKVSLLNRMNQRAQHFPSPPMSQHSSMPAMQLPDTKLRPNMGTGYASYFSAATKLVNAMEKLPGSRNYGHRLMRFLPRVRVRGV